MLNNVVLVGRLTKDPEVVDVEKGYKRTFIVVAVPRPYKNAKGEYETDFLGCTLWQLMATNTKEYCKKGDIVGVKGRVESKVYEKDDLKYFEKKLWIFLDEINTCNSMGLICEMMTKHSCQGKPLPKSIVFIGACNPYRMVVKDEEPNGLKMPGTKEMESAEKIE